MISIAPWICQVHLILEINFFNKTVKEDAISGFLLTTDFPSEL